MDDAVVLHELTHAAFKKYKPTLKNIKTYLAEVLQVEGTITRVEIERATHVGSLKKD